MGTQVIIRQYEPGDLPGAEALFEDVLGQPPTSFAAYLRWGYERNPAHADSQAAHWVAEAGNAIIGFISGMPVRVKVGNRYMHLLWAQNFMVHGAYRGKSVGRRLFQQLEAAAPVFIATGLNPISRGLFVRKGARDVDADSHGVFCDSKRLCLKAMWENIRQGRVTLSARHAFSVVRMAVLEKHLRSPGPHRARVESEPDIDASFDAFWHECSCAFPIIAVRDAEYLRWRYTESPFSDNYRIFAVRDSGAIRGYAIVTKNCKIEDFIVYPFDKKVFYTLWDAVLTYARERQRLYVDCIFPAHPHMARLFRSVGFVKTHVRSCFVVKASADADLGEFVYNPEHWYLSFGDSDLQY